MLLIANSRVLLDFEIVCLISLLIGLGVFGFAFGTFRKTVTGIGSEFHLIDLVLVWLPLAIFLITPFLLHLSPSTETVETTPRQDQMNQVSQFIIFGMVGFFTLLMINAFGTRDFTEVLGVFRLRWYWVLIIAFAGTVVAYIFCAQFVGKISKDILTHLFGELEQQKPVEKMRQLKSSGGLLFWAVFNACVMAPIVEELLFRGYFYGVVKRFSSPLFSALITGALFAVVHGNLGSLLPLWVLAIFLTLAYEFTRTIWVPIAIHALFNLTSVVLILFFSGSSPEPATFFFPVFNL